MHTSWGRLVFGISLCLVGTAAAQQNVTIEGRVLDGSGRPLTGLGVFALVDPMTNRAAGSGGPPTPSDGSFRVTVPAGVYFLTTMPFPPAPLLPTYVRVDARGGNISNFVLRVTAQTPLVPDDPPRASLIQASFPDEAGDATVTGAAGAVAPGSYLVLVTLDTGHTVTTQAGDDGSFRTSIFAPFGASILIKADPVGFALSSLNKYHFPKRQVSPWLSLMAGAIVRVPEPPSSGAGVPFGRAGLFNASALPAWTFQGTVSTPAVAPGGALRIDGTLRIASTALQQAGTMRVSAKVQLDRVSGPDGSGSLAQNIFASTLLTPTGLPIERQRNGRAGDGLDQTVQADLVKSGSDRAEASIHFALTLPGDVPAGYYVPVVSFVFEGVPEESPPSRFIIMGKNVRRDLRTAYLPAVRIGSPAPPRIPSMLLVDTLSDGMRGVRAIEDRSRFGLAPRIRMNETLIVPRLDGSGQPLTYRLEPFLPTVSLFLDGGLDLPLIPFRFPSGRLTVRIQAPDGTVTAIGPAPFMQPRLKSNGLLGTPLSRSDVFGNQFAKVSTVITECYQLSTLDPRFEVKFTQDGRHVIVLDGAIEDVWGNTWTIQGTYEVDVARLLSVDSAVVPGTPFEVGDVFSPAVTVTPPVPADIEVRVRLAPNSDPDRMIERVVRGRANRFGYFGPDGSAIVFDEPGEYRVDIVASFTDAQGSPWMGTRTWGSVVAPRDTPIVAHGRRAMVNSTSLGSQWFFRSQTASPTLPSDTHPNPPFHSGDVFWAQKSDSAFALFTFQDPGNLVKNLLQTRFLDSRPTLRDPGGFGDRVSLGELPLFSTRADRTEPHIDPSRVDLWGYSYRFVERPMIAVREVIGEDSVQLAYWHFDDYYGGQTGNGDNSDRPNDFKFEYGGVVLRGAALPRPLYGIYGSLFVLVPDDDPRGGTRIFPPFQGNGGGPSGGPLFSLKGQDIDAFIHLMAVRPGTVLEVGDTFSIAGAVAPTLPGLVSSTLTLPSGRKIPMSGRANKVGYYYRPQDDFIVSEPGIYTVEVSVTFDGQTSAGQLTAPFPKGDVPGSTSGRFFVYVVPRGSAPLNVGLPENSILPEPVQLDVTARPPLGMTLRSGHVTAMMPGFLLQTSDIANTAGSLVYRYDPATLARSFPNLDLKPPADVVTITVFAAGTDESGNPVYAAKVLALHGAELFNLLVPRTVSGVSYAVPSGGGSSITSAGESSSATVAYARVLPSTGSAAPLGMAIFGLHKNGVVVTEASVPASPLIQTGRIYADVGGPVNTGIAIANPNSQDAVVSFYFTDAEGKNSGQGSATIPAKGQIAKFLDQPPFNSAASVRGTFTFSSTQPISVLALRGRTNERQEFLITTLPIVPLPAATGEALLPHFADGMGWSTQVVLVNPTESTLAGMVQFLAPAGQPAAVTVDGQTAAAFRYSIPARSSRRLETSGVGATLISGSVRVVPDSNNGTPSGQAVFSLRKDGITVSEAGVPAAPVGSAFRLYVEATSATMSGIAIANASPTPAAVTFELTRLDGSSTGLTGTATVPGNGQVAQFLNQIAGFWSLPMPFQGILRASTGSGSRIAVTGLRGRNNERGDFLITTIPVVDEAAAPSSAEVFFPHLVDGEGYTTQFILFSGTANQALSGTLQFFRQSGQALDLTVR